MSAGSKAVFLSYASQDAEAAKRICEALRAAGVEVWFDQNELVGGDAWDAKIRQQIADCALFVPVISASTQARREGYFRLEWKLAAQRTHMIADGTPFLLPVVIDGTRDGEALVPAEFKSVQWTRLPGGETTPGFCARVRRVLTGETPAMPTSIGEKAAAAAASTVPATRRIAWVGYAAIAAGIGLGLFLAGRSLWEAPQAPAAQAGSAAEPIRAAPIAPSPAREQAATALTLVQALEATREDFALADEFMQRALKLDASDGVVWAVAAQVNSAFVYRGWDTSSERREHARTMAERAMRLAPNAPDAKLAQAGAWSALGINRAETEQLLREVVAARPDDKAALRFLAVTVMINGRFDECLALNERAAALPGGDPLALFNNARYLFQRSRGEEAFAVLDRSLAQKPFSSSLVLKAVMEIYNRGDLAAAEAAFGKISQASLLEDRANYVSGLIPYYRGDAEAAFKAWNLFPREYYADFMFEGPKGLVLGLAYELAGRTAAAAVEWRAALQSVEKRLAATPNNAARLYDKSYLLACLGEKAAAAEALRAYQQLTNGIPAPGKPLSFEVALIYARLGRLDELFAFFPKRNLARLGIDPRFAAVRADPRFAALVEPAPPTPAVTPAIDRNSVAVLAFANLSDEKANGYFSDGISEELLNVLAKVPGLKVSARTSAFYFKGRNTPIPEIAKQLGVAYVVEGSVRRSGDRVRITAQLIKAADGFHVWSETFTRDLKDIFAVQDEIAGLIAKNISPKLVPSAAVAARQVDPEAFQLYLEGRALAAKASVESLKQAIALFDRAVQRDPGFALARAQQARACVQLGRWGGLVPREAWAGAKAALAPALADAPDAPEVLVAHGWILRTADWKWRDAERAFARALEQRPSDTDVLVSAAVLKAGIGKGDEAHALARRAIELDPLNPATQFDLGLIYRFSDRLPEAERQFRRAIELSPGGQRYRTFLALVVVGLGRYDEAEELARDEPDVLSRLFVQGLAAAGRRDLLRLRETIAELESKRPTLGRLGDYSAYLSSMRAAAGDLDGAMTELEITRESRDPSIGWIKVNYLVRPLHTHPRWPEFLRSLGLADEQLK